ncbi:MAG: hypothetical protein GY853_05255 [PVC group bacterium]|nr:hypothetical protein [PVC group bacterium]
MNEIITILNIRFAILKNKLRNAHQHSRLKIFVVWFMIIGILGATFYVPYKAFVFLQSMDHVGNVIIERLMYLLFMGLFMMLVFSNSIICYSTGYRARETTYFFTLPIKYANIFFVKFIDSIILSSWAFLCFLLPIMAAYAHVKNLGFMFYLTLIVFFVPFAVVAAAIGSMITMAIVRFFPRKLYAILGWILGVGLVAGIIWLIIIGKGAKTEDEFLFVLTNLIPHFRFTQFVFAPNYWISEGIFKAIAYDYEGSFYWWLLLLSNALMLGQAAYLWSKRIYYDGWVNTSFSGITKNYYAGKGMADKICRRLSCVPLWMRSLIVKDIKVFCRDPVQWSQFTVFFGLLAIYFVNIRNFGYANLIPFWKNIVSFLNLTSTNLTLASLSVRFVFPQLSLEGKSFWILGLAPIKRQSLLFEKFWLNSIAALCISLPLITISNLMLNVSPLQIILSIFVVILMCFSLIALCVGLGALFPNFKEDNPAQIVSGFGGTLALVLCLVYIALNVMALAMPFHLLVTEQIGQGAFQKLLCISCVFVFILGAVSIFLSLFFGSRALKNLEM